MSNSPERRTIYMFSGTPFTERTKMEGHAVRAMYACCGATDYYMETGYPTYPHTLKLCGTTDHHQDVCHRWRRFTV